MQQRSDLTSLIIVHYVHNMVHYCCEVHTNAFPFRMLIFISKKMFLYCLNYFSLLFTYFFFFLLYVGNKDYFNNFAQLCSSLGHLSAETYYSQKKNELVTFRDKITVCVNGT